MKKLFTVMTVIGLLFVQGVTVSAIDETEDNSIPWTDIEEGKEIDEDTDDSIPWTDIEEGKEIDEDDEDTDDSIPWTDLEPATNLYAVSFESRGGEEIVAVTVEEDAVVEEPKEPTREGYDFKGWYTDEEWTELYDFTTAVKQDTTLYARWKLSVTPEHYTIVAASNVEIKRSELLEIDKIQVSPYVTIDEFIQTISERAGVKVLKTTDKEDDFAGEEEIVVVLWTVLGDRLTDPVGFELALEANPLVKTTIQITILENVTDATPLVPAEPAIPATPLVPAEVVTPVKNADPKAETETLPQTGVATGISLGLVSALSGVVTLIAKKKFRD